MKREEGRGKREEGRGKREEGRSSEMNEREGKWATLRTAYLLCVVTFVIPLY